jgi:hypothetical protein
MAELDWMILANYAEAPPGSGLVYIVGAGWDTITVGAPLPAEAPPGLVAAVIGSLVVRLKFARTETNRDYSLSMVVLDEDGGEVARVNVSFPVALVANLPATWEQGLNVVIPLTGLGLPKFGIYEIHVLLEGRFIGSRQFRVLKGF